MAQDLSSARPGMTSVQARPAALATALILLTLAAAPADAERPADAAALWRDLYGDDGVVSVTLPAAIAAGAQIQGSITFTEDAAAADVLYKACEVGQTCFATGVPTMVDAAGTTWSFDTTDIPLHSRALDRPHEYAEGVRAGFQFVVCLDNGSACPAPPLGACDQSTDRWLLFPAGRACDDASFDSDFMAWSETHYFGVDVTGSNAVPSAGVAIVFGVIAALAVAVTARRR